MALNKPTVQKPAEPTPVEDETVTLELALYTNYTWQGQAFSKGKPYRFKKSAALQLLSMEDHGRRIWRMWRPARPKVEAVPKVEDMTPVEVQTVEVEPQGVGPDPKRRIDVGTDDEIQDLLNRPDDGDEDGNVTV